MSCIFLHRQIAKKGFKSLSALTFPLKIGQHAWNILLVCECACVSLHICLWAYERTPSSHITNKKEKTEIQCNQNATVITLHFPRKKGVYKNLFAKGHTRQSNTSVSFSFCTTLLLLSRPDLSLPSTITIYQPRLSSSRAFLIRQTQPVLLSEAATASSYQPVTSYLSFRFLSRERRLNSNGIEALWTLNH